MSMQLDTRNRAAILGVLLVLLVLSAASAMAQGALASMTLFHAPGQKLYSGPMTIGGGRGYSQAGLAGVGGVAFEHRAEPAPGLAIETLALHHHADRDDGRRLAVTLNGRAFTLRAPDWQLVPLVRYANSEHQACFTFFGHLLDPRREEQVREQGGQVVNYHPAFEHTLLGLRLMQADMLLMYPECADLPDQDGRYILGTGESPPDVAANTRGIARASQLLERLQQETGARFRSYLICDHERKVRIEPVGDELRLTGTPYFYFWRYFFDAADASAQQAAQDSVIAGIELELAAWQGKQRSFDGARGWFLDTLLDELERYEAGYAIFSSGSVVDCLQRGTRDERRHYLDGFGTGDLHRMLATLRLQMRLYTPLHLETVSDGFSAANDRIAAMNPAVWDATVATMRLGAFFRYVRHTHPMAWAEFMAAMRGVPDGPEVVTPTVIWP